MASGLENIETIESPFRRFVTTIGVFPTAFTDAMTYYECLAYLVKYLEETVIPAVNENAEALEELQQYYIQLKSYVENYFANLDVQEEINNKLDQMAEDGTLQEIITAYIQANVAWTFDTVADMKSATNLVAGSYARTLGFYTLNDGGGATYYITDSGTADEKAVIAVGSLYANIAPDKIVSPEQYGAKGDGISDDTESWQLAVNSGRCVIAKPVTYVCGKIEVTENITIDCNHAKFICNADTLFEVKGEVVTTLTSQTNYIANNTNYVIADDSYSDYTGYAVLKGDNNFQQSRDYYKGGFVAEFKSGKLNGSYPIPVTNTSIDIVTPITGELKNIDGITHTTPALTTISINVIYGLGYKISNICEKSAIAYKFIQLSYCMNCICDNVNVNMHFESSNNNSYIVDFDNSSFCSVLNSTLHNDLWHAITTGGSYLCLSNKVSNCTLLCDNQYAYLDHENARYTSITDSTIQCVGVSGGGFIDKVIVLSNNNSNKDCYIRLCPVSEIGNANYTVTNCVLKSSDSTAATCAGILLELGSQQTGAYSYYMNNIHIDNVINTNGTVSATTKASFSDTQSTFYIGKVEILNSNIDVLLFPNTMTHVNIDNYELLIENATIKNGSTYVGILAGNCKANKVTVNHSHLKYIRGAINTLILNDYQNEETENATVLTVSSKLIGSNLKSKIRADALLIPTELQITDMFNTSTDKWFNICNDASKKYYTHLVTGTMTTVEITYQ